MREQGMGKKAEALATDEHGKTRKENQAEAKAFATDEHGITRKRQKQRHGRKNKQKLATETRHLFQSWMRERRYKYTVW